MDRSRRRRRRRRPYTASSFPTWRDRLPLWSSARCHRMKLGEMNDVCHISPKSGRRGRNGWPPIDSRLQQPAPRRPRWGCNPTNLGDDVGKVGTGSGGGEEALSAPHPPLPGASAVCNVVQHSAPRTCVVCVVLICWLSGMHLDAVRHKDASPGPAVDEQRWSTCTRTAKWCSGFCSCCAEYGVIMEESSTATKYSTRSLPRSFAWLRRGASGSLAKVGLGRWVTARHSLVHTP